MKKRIGNDIQFTWHIYRKSGETQTPESFDGKEVEVKLISPLQRPVTIEDVSIATGVVTFTFRGKHQVTLGNYVAILQENRGENNMVTLDVVSAVSLVPHSYMEEDGDEGDVIEAESVELTSTISAGGGGGIDAYTKAETDALLEGKYDKVDGIRFLAGQRWIVVQDENGKAATTISPNEVQFEEVDGTEGAVFWLNGGYLRLNDKYHKSQTGNKIATDLELAGKQDTIADLAAIRSGAQAGATAVQPSDLTPIDDRLGDVEYCLGDYIKDTYVFNARNKPEVSSEPVYTDKTLYTVVNKDGSFKSLNCKLSSDSQAISALWIGRLYDNGKILFTQSGTATLYLVLYANLSSLGSMLLSVCDSNDNVVMNVHSSELTYNSSNVCTAFSCEVAEGYYIKMEYNDPNVCVWLGQIDLEINEVKQISTDVHANSDAIVAIEQKIPAQASSSNKLVDKNSLASVATTGSYNDLSDKPDLSAFITNSVDDLVNYYLKSETYTKTEVQQLIGAIQQFHYEVYPTLPQTGASNVLYLIGPAGTGTDKYEEYVYANNDWTKIGDTSIDLSGYVTTEALNTALADYVTSSALSLTLANYYNKTEVDGLFAGKADKSEMSVVPGTGDDADKTTITLKQGTSTTVLTAHQDVADKEDKIPIVHVASGTTAINAAVNTYYEVAGEVGALAITLPTPTDLTKVSMVVIHLTTGATPNVVIGSAATVDKFSSYAIEANKEYEINCLFNGDKWVVADMEVV